MASTAFELHHSIRRNALAEPLPAFDSVPGCFPAPAVGRRAQLDLYSGTSLMEAGSAHEGVRPLSCVMDQFVAPFKGPTLPSTDQPPRRWHTCSRESESKASPRCQRAREPAFYLEHPPVSSPAFTFSNEAKRRTSPRSHPTKGSHLDRSKAQRRDPVLTLSPQQAQT
jgi:hypothetical protein